jgi:hypothetical protein
MNLRSSMPFRLLPLIAMLCLSGALHAQNQSPPARFQVYGGYAYLSNSINGVPGSQQALNGWNATVAFGQWHNLRFKIDVSGYMGTNAGAPQHPYFIMGGAQYSHRLGRETVFVEGMGGDGGINKNWGAGATTGETASFAALMGGGLDTPLTRHMAFRVSGGYQYSYFALVGKDLNPYRSPGLPTNFGRLSSGLVFQF